MKFFSFSSNLLRNNLINLNIKKNNFKYFFSEKNIHSILEDNNNENKDNKNKEKDNKNIDKNNIEEFDIINNEEIHFEENKVKPKEIKENKEKEIHEMLNKGEEEYLLDLNFQEENEKKSEKKKDDNLFDKKLENIYENLGLFLNKVKVNELDIDIEEVFKEYISSGVKNNYLDNDIHEVFKNYGKKI
jgi:hypothetical protein